LSDSLKHLIISTEKYDSNLSSLNDELLKRYEKIRTIRRAQGRNRNQPFFYGYHLLEPHIFYQICYLDTIGSYEDPQYGVDYLSSTINNRTIFHFNFSYTGHFPIKNIVAFDSVLRSVCIDKIKQE
jgi:hypothetical protein